MKSLNLVLHAGGKSVDRGLIEKVETPLPSGRWNPISHYGLLTGIQSSLVRAGFKVEAEAHALAKNDARYFGLLQLSNGHNSDDYSFVVGLRNSHDKMFPAGLVVGSGVFVCDNLAFSGEIKIARKHTTNINRDLPQLINAAVGKLADYRGKQDARLSRYKEVELHDAQAHDLIIQALDARVVNTTRVPDVLKEWRNPSHPEFATGKTAWRLFNAFTETLKDTNLFGKPRATQALHGLLDTAVGLN